jgi:hypothetical protein
MTGAIMPGVLWCAAIYAIPPGLACLARLVLRASGEPTLPGFFYRNWMVNAASEGFIATLAVAVVAMTGVTVALGPCCAIWSSAAASFLTALILWRRDRRKRRRSAPSSSAAALARIASMLRTLRDRALPGPVLQRGGAG